MRFSKTFQLRREYTLAMAKRKSVKKTRVTRAQLVEKSTELLREWARAKSDLIISFNVGGASVYVCGTVTDVSDGLPLAQFHFETNAPMWLAFAPGLWREIRIEGGKYRSLWVGGKGQSFVIAEATSEHTLQQHKAASSLAQ